MAGPTTVIDTHVHFLAPDRLRYAWTDGIPALRRPFLPADYRAATAGIAIDGLLFVESGAEPDQALAEAAWVGGLRAEEPRLRGIVAHAPLSDPAARDAALAALAARGDVVAVRDLIQHRPPGWCRRPEYIAGVRAATRLGLAVELCVYHPQLGDALELVAACPDTRFVLDHAGKPGIRERLLDPWRERIAALARHPRVVCKISGLPTEADLARWRPEDVLPYARHVVDCFGPERVLYASDWPVMNLAGDYQRWFALTEELSRGWSATDRERFYRGNAVAFYGLSEHPGARSERQKPRGFM